MPITEQLEHQIQRWVEAQVIDREAAERIRTYESTAQHGLRWPVVLAVAFGAIMVAAGVLLFVTAHWDELSPAQRFALVLLMTGGFHLAAGALMPRMRALGIALHGVGTASLGGGIFLAGQIFNLEEHWPGGILMWAIGAALTWWILRDWVQGALAMLLVPAWIASEWSVRAEHYASAEKYVVEFLFLTAIAYLGAQRHERESGLRLALIWIGGLAILPAGAALALVGYESRWTRLPQMSSATHAAGILIALVLPLAVAWALRGKGAVWNVGFAAWALLVVSLDERSFNQNLARYAVYALGTIALVLWGLREQRRERINLGVAGFAITIISFYFSTVMDKLGRSASLVGFGLILLLGGWKLEQLRRKLVAKTKGGAA